MTRFRRVSKMLIVIYVLSIVFGTIAFADEKGIEETIDIRVGAYSINSGRGVDKELNLNRTAEAIRELDADIIGLNAVDNKTNRSGKVDQTEYIAKELGYQHYVFGKAIDYQGGEYGNGILSKYPIVSSKNHILPTSDLILKEARSMLECQINVEGEIINILTTHLGMNEEERAIYIEYIVDVIEELEGPVILLGNLPL